MDLIRDTFGKIRKVLNEGVENEEKTLSITKSTPQFGDVRVSQEKALKKTIGDSIELGDDGLVYYASKEDLVLTGKIGAVDIKFQFRYNDPSGEGCYIWLNALHLTEVNLKTINKIRDAFLNWKDSLVENGDLLDRLKKITKS